MKKILLRAIYSVVFSVFFMIVIMNVFKGILNFKSFITSGVVAAIGFLIITIYFTLKSSKEEDKDLKTAAVDSIVTLGLGVGLFAVLFVVLFFLALMLWWN